jgi:RNA polymerase sigma-70 factor (ECF subfamily)
MPDATHQTEAGHTDAGRATPAPPAPGSADPLLDRLRGGDQQALAELFARHRPQLRRMVDLRIDPRLAARVDPSDVLQEAYVDALARYGHYFAKPGGSFYVWLRLIVGQRLIDLHRRHVTAKMRGAGQERAAAAYPAGGGAPATSLSLARHLIAQMDSPSQVARQGEALAQVQGALESLDEVDREILTLRHFEELTNNEVAELLGLEKAAASNRYVRALGRLRQALASVPGFFEEEDEEM